MLWALRSWPMPKTPDLWDAYATAGNWAAASDGRSWRLAHRHGEDWEDVWTGEDFARMPPDCPGCGEPTEEARIFMIALVFESP